MTLSAELESLLRSSASSQEQTHELRASRDALVKDNHRLKAELAGLRSDQHVVLQTVAEFQRAAREDLQISAAYSQSLQALSNSKAQAISTLHNSQLRIEELEGKLRHTQHQTNLLQGAVARLESEAHQAESQHTRQIQSLQSSHHQALEQLQADLSNITDQKKLSDKECEAKRIHIAIDQKTINQLKSKLASVRMELMQMQQSQLHGGS